MDALQETIPPEADHFAALGLPRRLLLDAEELTRAFLALSREVHPDRFAGAPREEREAAERRSARVNDAYRTLKDPVLRAEHLLALSGIERPRGEARCPPDLLGEVFELRERLAEDSSETARAEVRGLLEAADADLRELFARHDAAGGAEERASILAKLREALDRRKFLAGLSREAERTRTARPG